MNPRIVAVSGPLDKSVFPIGDDDFDIGRGPKNHARLDDPLVSRRHCTIWRGHGRTMLADMRSVHGTFVNGFCFPAKLLVHGDRIRLGRSIFVYLEGEESDALLTPPPDMQSWERFSLTEKTAGYEAARAIVLEAFLRINASINAIRSPDEIQARVLELICRVIPADRVAILLAGHDQDRLVSTTYRSISSQDTDPFPIDETLTLKALREGVPVYQEPVICCPLTVLNTKVGVIYAATAPDAFEYFTAGHMPVLQSIAGFTAVALEHARYVGWLEGENRRLNDVLNVEHGMIGQSEKMNEVFQFISRAGPSDRPVLILGDTGTGKELVARAIHQNSSRCNRGFFAVNCGAFTETLLQSELFGHEKGAFTGATAQRKGLFEAAGGGTVFLDEVGELPMAMQADLLRVLQEGELKRVGGNGLVRVDVRVIAATNRNLQKEIKEGRFRRDLFFRLNVLEVEMPPLSERLEDIPLLAAHFLKKYRHIRSDKNPPVLGISPEAHHLLASYSWPGNVRELENAIERSIALGVSPYIRPDDLPKTLRAPLDQEGPALGELDVYDRELNAFRRSLFIRMLKETAGNRPEAARRLGLHPTYFARLCRDLDVNWK